MLDDALRRPARLDIAFNRFPLKPLWDAAALGRIVISRGYSMRQKAACASFYFTAGGIRNLFPTLTRSGSHWSLLGVALARDLSQGGDGEFDFRGDAWIPRAGAVYTKLDWREPLDDWDAEADPAILSVVETRRMVREGRSGVLARPLVFHSHHPYFRLRTARLRDMRIVVVLRSIYDSMESKYHKHRVLIGMGVRPLEYRKDAGAAPPSAANDWHFPWDKLLGDAIEFFNSWGDALRWHPRIRVFRYEDLLADPAGAHKEITDFWGMNLPYSCLEEAFRRVSKERMRAKLPAGNVDATSRVAMRTAGAALTDERVDYIRHWLERRLVHDFGYGTVWSARGRARSAPRRRHHEP